MMKITLSVPPVGAKTCASGSLSQQFATNASAIPIGREALVRLGGTRKAEKSKGGAESDFDMSLIAIPEGVTPQTLKNYTLYQLLGFAGEIGASADAEVIKKAYHKAVLMYHPDKAQFKTKDGKEDRSVFLKIQEASNVLSDEKKRRAYDSQLPFDESIPTEELCSKYDFKVKPQKFFKLFDPVFKRNARFAVKKPVPDLGDDNTPLNVVFKFYDYWNKYESWRDFTGVDAEYKPDDAGSREEKRYMQKENEKKAKGLKKKEMERIIALVALAEKRDPRIARDKELKKANKDAEKNAREASEKRRTDLDKESKEWSEALESAASSKNGLSKDEKEKLKKAQSKARNTFRKLIRATCGLGLAGADGKTKLEKEGEYGCFTEKEVDLICNNTEMDEVNDMCTAMGGEAATKEASLFVSAGVDRVRAVLARVLTIEEVSKEDDTIAKEAKKREAEERNSPSANSKKRGHPSERDWASPSGGDSPVDHLEAAILRYKPGHPQVIDSKPVSRWVTVANYVNFKAKPAVGEAFTADECLIKAFLMSHPDK